MSDSNGTSLLRFAGDNKLDLVNTFFSVPNGCNVSYIQWYPARG